MNSEKQIKLISIINAGDYLSDDNGNIFSQRKILAGNIMPNGYRFYTLRFKGKNIGVYGHQFVYLFSFGQYDHKKVINHINRKRSDNRPCNLECITQKENLIQSSDRKKKLIGNYRRKISETIKHDIINLFKDGNSILSLSKRFNISRQTIAKYCK